MTDLILVKLDGKWFMIPKDLMQEVQKMSNNRFETKEME